MLSPSIPVEVLWEEKPVKILERPTLPIMHQWGHDAYQYNLPVDGQSFQSLIVREAVGTGGLTPLITLRQLLFDAESNRLSR